MDRQDENDEISAGKRLRFESPSANKPMAVTKYVDLNSLNLENLYNVTVANECLRAAANDVYKRKFATKVNLFRVHGIQKSSTPYQNENIVFIYNFETCHQFLRCFGSSIKHLIIDYGQTTSNRYDYIHQYINEYCAETLVTIEFCGKLPFPNAKFDKPFVNVRNVDIIDCDLGEQFHQIFKWFPDQSHLNILFDVWNHPFFIVAPPPELKHLVIKFNGIKCVEFSERYKRVVDQLQLNHQLQSLTIKSNTIRMTMNFLLDIIIENQSISKLIVDTGGCTLVNKSETLRLVQEHQMLVELDLPFYRFTSANVNTIVRRLTLLQKFCFRIQGERVHKSIMSKLDCKWRSTYRGGSYVTLNRRH